MANEVRAKNLRTASGLWVIGLIYSGIDDLANYRKVKDEAGWDQLEGAAKRWIAARYHSRLKDFSHLVLPATRPWAENVFWMYAVRVTEHSPLTRDSVREKLSAFGIETRDFFYPCATQPMMARYNLPIGHFPNTDKVAATGFYLPSGLATTAEQIDLVCDALASIFGT